MMTSCKYSQRYSSWKLCLLLIVSCKEIKVTVREVVTLKEIKVIGRDIVTFKEIKVTGCDKFGGRSPRVGRTLASLLCLCLNVVFFIISMAVPFLCCFPVCGFYFMLLVIRFYLCKISLFIIWVASKQ